VLNAKWQQSRYAAHSPAAARLLAAWQLAKYPIKKALRGSAPPPDIFKRRTLRNYLRRYNLRTFVETGTYLGETIAYMLPYCDRLFSIELQDRLFVAASKRFRHSPQVQVFQGDSRVRLPEILTHVDTPALFWLDGHFAAGTTVAGEVACPALDELELVLLRNHEDVILIDDAREFDGKEYPSIDVVTSLISSRRPEMNVVVRDDIIRISPVRSR
jgi:hypothetical protein